MSVLGKYESELRENRGIEYADLTLYPLTVKDYALYASARPSFELMQASLPPAFARYSWCVCLDEMDRYNAEHGEKTYYLNTVLIVLAKALHLHEIYDMRSKSYGYPIKMIYSEETGRLSAIFIDCGNGNNVLLTMQQMSELREIIAAQNLYKIPDENWNPDLLRAAQYTEAQKTSSLIFDLETLVYSVASNMHTRASEVWQWSIREFELTQKAIDRTMNYQIYTQATMSGFVTFKNGNPCPSWRLDAKTELPSDFKKISDIDAGAKGLLKMPENN